ncbi:hypothetical protein GCM10010124_36590 [Pilimelia terevasa]|uniref:Uncharacterized protein n=1 Tax=Pilimelia terevasa TaxID=53372 RepID=A0A8J3BTU7_9ACTN|nr:hypothetical protein [Pilimelia terevasa]GGK40498.1 hypothetical protein GCM10010124_36590 [Pilimelia terevasa]
MTSGTQPLPVRLAAGLARRGTTPVLLATIAYLLLALYAPKFVGAVLLLALACALAALGRYTWRSAPAGARVIRAAVVCLLVGVALLKLG